MADSVATIGLAVDSAPVKRAASDLTVLSAAAEKAQTSSNALTSASDKVQKQLAPLSATANRLTAEYQRMTDATAKTVARHADFTKSGQLARFEMINLSRQIQDVGVSLVSGQSPFMVLAQQGAQVADIFSSSKTGTVGGAFRQVASSVVGFLTPMRLVGIGVAASGAAAYAAYGSWKSYTLQLDDAAKAAGVSTASFSKLQAAAQVKGIAPDEFNKGISEFARNVYDAQNGLGELATVFRANNKQASTFDEYLEKGADLIRNCSSDQQRLVLLQQMGLPATMEWVRLLNGGADGLRRAKAEMADFAANDNLILAARRFDEGWNRAWVNFGRNGKSAIQTAIDSMTSLSDKADTLAKRVGGSSFWNNFLPANHEEIAKGMGIKPVTGFESRFGGESVNPARNNGALQQGLERRAETMRSGTTEDYQTELRKLQIDSQRIAQLGQLASVEEVVRQKQNELTAAGKQGYGVSKDQEAAIRNMVRAQEEMSRVQAQASIGIFDFAAAQKAANDTMKFWQDRGLIKNSEDFANAQNYMNKQLRETEDAAKVAASKFPQLTQAINDATNVYKQIDQVAISSMNTLTTGIVDVLDGTKSLKGGFTDMSKAVVRAIEEMIIKLYVIGPLMKSLQFGMSNLFGGGAAGGVGAAAGNAAPILGSANGNIFAGGNVVPFAHGGVFDRPHVFPMANGGIGLLGEAGPEAVMPLKRGADGKLGVAGAGGGGAAQLNVVVNNAPSSPNVSSKRNASGGHDVMIDFKNAVLGIVADDAANNGKATQSMMARASGFNGR